MSQTEMTPEFLGGCISILEKQIENIDKKLCKSNKRLSKRLKKLSESSSRLLTSQKKTDKFSEECSDLAKQVREEQEMNQVLVLKKQELNHHISSLTNVSLPVLPVKTSQPLGEISENLREVLYSSHASGTVTMDPSEQLLQIIAPKNPKKSNTESDFERVVKDLRNNLKKHFPEDKENIGNVFFGNDAIKNMDNDFLNGMCINIDENSYLLEPISNMANAEEVAALLSPYRECENRYIFEFFLGLS